MNKINNKSIIFSLGILAILTFGLITIPTKASANEDVYGGSSSVWCRNCSTASNNQNTPTNNPKPSINSISPSSSNIGVGTKTITIKGESFVPSSIARVNGSNRPTTFIDSSHLLMQITGNDTLKYYSNGGFFVTVFNPAPGGGYSNTAFFAVNNNAAPNTAGTNTENDTSTNFTNIMQNENNGNNEYSDLASNAIFGSGIHLGLIQWIFLAILVLLIVILVRKVFGADRKYHAIPLKHD